ncbi:pectinesterase inhibitor-like [Lotus japonicus]|uniref:pectinesterase inhibitor-like n=1 Tax=Lotus japonicus TaxID=34305 RepID=UPI00258BFE1A|nr:pectinesterase inhibitor-like [Lotus japonicus]
MINYNPLCLFCCFVLPILLFVYPTTASPRNNVTPLVDQVCAKTSNYSLCVETLYSDPHTPEADIFGLTTIAFRLAHTNATDTRDYLHALLVKYPTWDLQKCARDYEKAVFEFERAFKDLKSRSYSFLPGYVRVASHGADDCQHASKAIPGHDVLLADVNNALKGLCEICLVISIRLTTTGS